MDSSCAGQLTHTQVKENGFDDEFWERSGYLTAADVFVAYLEAHNSIVKLFL